MIKAQSLAKGMKKMGNAPFKSKPQLQVTVKKFGTRDGGETWKDPKSGGKGTIAASKSSGQSNPSTQSASDKNRYKQAKQSLQYNNETHGPTKFVN